MFKDFKEFAIKGNMLDMAVGIIIGAAFGTIVTSLVNDLLMPPIGMLTGGLDFSQLHLVLDQGDPSGPYATLEAAHQAGAVTLNWGSFINHVLSFLIVAFSVFLVVKGFNELRRREEAAPEPAGPPEPSAEETLLAEIRDLLAARPG